MMIFDTDILISALTAIAIGSIAATFLKMRAQKYRDRARDLKIARASLETFSLAYDKIINEPAVSKEMKLLVMSLARAIGHHDVAKYFVKELVRGSLANERESGDKNFVKKEFDALRRSRPDMIEEIDRALRSGMVALILRWPETSKMFKEFTAFMTDERAEMAAVAKVSRYIAKVDHKVDKKSDRQGFDGGGVVAA